MAARYGPSYGNVHQHVGRGGFQTRPYGTRSPAIIPMTPRIVPEKTDCYGGPHSRYRAAMYRITQGLITLLAAGTVRWCRWRARQRRALPGYGPTFTRPRWGREARVLEGAAGVRWFRMFIPHLKNTMRGHVGRGGFQTRPYGTRSPAIIPMTPRIVPEKTASDG
jgi:hypothetical protein